jgi:hypothetical protein
MADKLNLTLQVNAETGQLEVVGQKLDALGTKSNKLAGEASSLFKSFLPFATAGGILAFFSSAVKSAEEENEVLRTLKFTLESNGQSWERNSVSIQNWAGAIQAATRFSDSEALKTLDRLTRATGNVSQAQAASTIAMNLAVASGKTLGETTDLVNGLINKNTRSITEAHREYGTFAGKANDAQGVLDALAAATKNAATAEDDLTKSVNVSKNAFEDLQKQVGKMLLPAVGFLATAFTDLLKVVDNVGQVIAAVFANLFHAIQGVGNTMSQVLQGHFKAAAIAAKQSFDNIDEDWYKTGVNIVSTWRDVEQQKTQVVEQAGASRVQVTNRLNEEEINKKKEQVAKFQDFEAEMARNMSQLSNDSYKKKVQALNAEIAATRQKINRELTDEKLKQKALDDLAKEELARANFLAVEETRLKAMQSLEIAGLAVQTFAVLNSMGDEHTQAELNRARAILAMEKAIAIARVWAEAAGKGPLMIGIAAAQTALLIAQFAQQSKALGQAQDAFKEGQQRQVSMVTQLPGGGLLTDVAGGGGGTTFVGGGGTGGGASFGTGGGAGVNIQIGDIILQGVNDASKIPDNIVEAISERIIERIKARGELSFLGVA